MSKSGHSNFEPLSVGTVGQLLVDQLQASTPAEREKGYDSVVELATKLDFTKQKEFITQLATALKLDQQDTFTAIAKAYNQYCRNDAAGIAECRNVYTQAKLALFKKGNSLRDAPDNKQNRKERKDVAKKLKKLDQKYKKDMETRYDDTQKSALREALRKAYAELKQHLDPTIHWQPLLQKLFTAPPGYPGDFYNAPVLQVTSSNKKNPNNPKKIDLRKAFETSAEMEHCLFMGLKEGGANSPGEFGARYLRVYQDQDGNLRPQIVFNKQATDDCIPNYRENAAEVLASRLMARIIGDYAASAYFALKPGGKKGEPADAYVASIFFDDFTEVHKAALLKTAVKNFKTANEGRVPDKAELASLKAGLKGRVYGRIAGKGPLAGQHINTPLVGHPNFAPGCLELMQDPEIEQKSQGSSLFASLLFGNDQIHSENAGIAAFPTNEPHGLQKAYGVLDFGGAFRRPYTTRFTRTQETSDGCFASVVTPETPDGKKYTTAYLLAYPEELRRSKNFIEGIDVVAQFNFAALEDEIDQAVDYVIEYYGETGFTNYFAKELNTQNSSLNNPLTVRQESKAFLKETLFARQLSLREFSLTSKLENIRLKQQKGEPPDFNLQQLFQENPFYFIMQKENSAYKNLAATILTEEKTYGDLFKLLAQSTPQDFRDFLDRVKIFIDPQETALLHEYQLLRTFFAKDDAAAAPKACDEAYHFLKKVYKKIQNEVYFQCYFLDRLANKPSAIQAKPIIPLETLLDVEHPKKISTIFDGVIFSEKLQALATELLQDNSSQPEFFKHFHTTVVNLAFDTAHGFQPWLVEALGYEQLKAAISMFSADEVSVYLFQALQKRLLTDMNTINSEKTAAISVFIDKQTRLLQGYAQQLRQLELLKKNPQFSAEMQQKLAETLPQKASEKLRESLTTPLDTVTATLQQTQKMFEQQLQANYQKKKICRELISTAQYLPPAAATPRATVVNNNPLSSSDFPQNTHLLVFYKEDNNQAKVNISERRDPTDQKAISDITGLDEDLDATAVLATALIEKFPEVDIYADKAEAQEFFRTAFEEMREKDHALTVEGFFKALRPLLEKEHDDIFIHEAATDLFRIYQNQSEQLDPSTRLYFPNDLLIRTALHQVETHQKFSGEQNPHIVITDAWDPHYAEALLLVCSMKGITDCVNKSGWEVKDINQKLTVFKAFYERNYKSIKTSTTTQVSKIPAALYGHHTNHASGAEHTESTSPRPKNSSRS